MKHGQKLHSNETNRKLSIIVSRINQVRIAKKMSQRHLARKAKVAAITIAKVESGEQFYSLATIIKLCSALNFSLSELFIDI